MDNRAHLITQAAGAVDDVITCHLNGETLDPVDKLLMDSALNACLNAGIPLGEINAVRTTALD